LWTQEWRGKQMERGRIASNNNNPTENSRGYKDINKVLGVSMDDLNCKDNVIEWLCGSKTAAFTLSQKKYINRVERLAEKYPEKVQILHRNSDGSIWGHISTKAVGFNQLALKNGGINPFQQGEDEDGDDEEATEST